MQFLISSILISRTKIKHIDFYFMKKNSIEGEEDFKKKRIKDLKLKEPIQKSSWNYGDIFTDIKERIKELKIKEPVKKTTWIDEF